MEIKRMTTGMAVLFLASAPLWGSGPSVKEFPPRFLPEQNAPKAQKAPAKAPLNQERELGTKIFGVTSLDSYVDRHFVNMYSGRTYDLEHLECIQTPEEKESVRRLHMINAGAWAGYPENKYYAYRVKYYTIGITYSDSWLTVDPSDGSWNKITDLDNKFHEFSYLYDMAWNPVEEQMYGLIQSTERIASRIGIVNLEDSSIDTWVDLPDYYFCIAFDYDGMLYGIRWIADSDEILIGAALDRFDEDFEVLDSRELKVNGAPFRVYYQNGLDFDHTTGDLWWTACDTDGNQALVKINPDTAETERCGSVGFNECVVGLHVPFLTAEDRQAPAQVNGLNFTPCTDGSNTVTLSWTNPTTMWNRQSLSEITDIAIWRDSFEGEPLAVVAAEGTGASQSYLDESADKGVHKYYVCARNSKGRGVPTIIDAYVGRDLPGPVRNLEAIPSDDRKGATIQWRAPNTGDSGGWFDTEGLTYKIVRNPGNTLLAEGLTKRTYVDSDIPETRLYTYTVTPSNADGEGTPADAEPVLVGGAIPVPFTTDFSTQIDGDRFTSFDSFGYSGYEYDSFTSSMRSYCQNGENDMTLATPAINVEMGKTYRVDWDFDVTHYGYQIMDIIYQFQITGGGAATPESMKTVIADYPELLSTHNGQMFHLTTYFTADRTGEYFFGLRNVTKFYETDSDKKHKYNGDVVHVKGFTIQEAPDGDLGIGDFSTRLALSNKGANCFEVSVINNGTSDVSDYDVEIGLIGLDGVFRKIGSLKDDSAQKGLPVLKGRSETPVEIFAFENVRNLQEVAARTVMEGDGNSFNDMSEPVMVDFSDIYPLNQRFSNDDLTLVSWLPVKTYNAGTVSQTIYDADMIKFFPSADVTAPVVRTIGWHYKADKDVLENNIKVYLGQTSKKDFGDADTQDNLISGMTLVYEGSEDYYLGEHFSVLNLDTPFTLDPSRNLVVTVEKYQTANVGEFPLFFYSYTPFVNRYPSIMVEGSSPISYSDGVMGSKSVRYPESPVLYLGGDGFQSVNVSGVADTFTVLGGDIRYYDLNGNAVNPTRLLPGVYVRVKDGKADKILVK